MLHAAESAVAVAAWRRAWSPARSALSITQRTFLPEADEPWRLRLADVRLRALEAYAKTCLELGGAELPGAERATRELLELAPLRESGQLLLMRALSASGNVAEALAAYERLRVLLREELGVDPGDAVQDEYVRPSGSSRSAFDKVSLRPPQPCRRMLIFMTITSTTTSNQLHLDDLAGVRGAIITPDDPRYDQARAVHNGAVDRYPLAIVQCADVADVIACVAYARDHVLPLAIRGGGHHGGGFAVWNDALVIDLSGLRSTSVDPEAGTVRVDGGCVWGDVDHATGAFGMALPSGFMSTTGVGGLTLGGGIGYLTRLSASRSTIWCRPMWYWPTVALLPRAPTRTVTCSGRCEEAAVTSGSSPHSRSVAIRSVSTA